MNQNKSETTARQRHFLFHVFRMDKEENPMPTNQAEALLQRLRKMFKNEKGGN